MIMTCEDPVAQSRTMKSSMSENVRKLWKKVKRRYGQISLAVPQHYISNLPADPLDFKRLYPSMYAAVFVDAAHVPSQVLSEKLMRMEGSFNCRGNAILDAREQLSSSGGLSPSSSLGGGVERMANCMLDGMSRMQQMQSDMMAHMMGYNAESPLKLLMEGTPRGTRPIHSIEDGAENSPIGRRGLYLQDDRTPLASERAPSATAIVGAESPPSLASVESPSPAPSTAIVGAESGAEGAVPPTEAVVIAAPTEVVAAKSPPKVVAVSPQNSGKSVLEMVEHLENRNRARHAVAKLAKQANIGEGVVGAALQMLEDGETADDANSGVAAGGSKKRPSATSKPRSKKKAKSVADVEKTVAVVKPDDVAKPEAIVAKTDAIVAKSVADVVKTKAIVATTAAVVKPDDVAKPVRFSLPAYCFERSRSQIMCRTGLRGPGQSFRLSYGDGADTVEIAEKKAIAWVREQRSLQSV